MRRLLDPDYFSVCPVTYKLSPGPSATNADLKAALVGTLLLVAFLAGAVGALLLIRAANGPPSITPTSRSLMRSVADHGEALAAARALRCGIALTLGCVILLVAAVGVTWYGPVRDQTELQILTRVGRSAAR